MEAAICAASVFLTSAAPAPRQLQSRSPPPWSGTDTPAVPKPGLAPQGKHRSSARNIPAARHPHHPEPAGKAFPSPAPPSRTAPPAPPIRPAVSKEVVPAPEPPPFIHVRADAPKVPDTRIPHQPQKRRPAPLSDSPTHPPRAGEVRRSPTAAHASRRPPLTSYLLSPRQAQKNRRPRRNRHPSSTSSTLHPRAIRISPNRLGKSTLFLPRHQRPRRPKKRRPAPLLKHPYAPTRAGEEHRSPHHPTSASSPAPSAPRTGWEKAPSSCHVFHVRAARKSATPHLSPPPRTRPHQGKAPEPAPTHPHPRPPAPLSDSLLTRPTQAPPLATPQRPKKRHPASRRPPPRAFPHLQVPPLPGRHKKSGSPLKAAALRSNRRAISYP